MSKITDAEVEAACRAMCKSNGTGQCAAICLSHFSIRVTQGGVCPEATRVYGRRAKAALEAAEAVRVKPITMMVSADPRVSQSAAFMTPAESNLQKVQIASSTIPEGFIPWHGGECPVAEGTVVDMLFRDGIIHGWRAIGRHVTWWSHMNVATDVVAYRIHKPENFRLEAGKYYIDARGERTRLVRGKTAPMPGLFHDGGARVWKADGTAKNPGVADILALSSNQENNHD